MKETGIVCGELVAPVPVTVIADVYVPAESPATFAVTVSEPVPVPDAGETASHAAGLEAFQFSVPVPELLMLTDCAGGLDPPCVPEKLRLVGASPMVGINGAVSVRVTVTVCGVLVAPVAATVTGAEYVPADIPAVLTENVTEPAPVPLRTLGVNHGALSDTDQFSVPAPALLIVSVWAVGLLPPWTPLNDRLLALRPIVGVGAAVIESVTAIDWGVLVAPDAAIITLPE